MINLTDKKILIMGLGRFGGGVGAARFAAEHGAIVTVTDSYPADKLADSIAALNGLDITFHLGEHQRSDFTDSDLIIVNPAVAPENEYLQIAKDAGVELTTEMNLLWQYSTATKLGITGSNGKSTTTAMLYHILSTCINDRKVWLGGNIGKGSLLAKIDDISIDDILVLELSSFQLEDLARIEQSPHIAIVTNIAPNHLDRHGTMENYISAKQTILKYQQENDFAILCGEDKQLKSWETLGLAAKEYYSAGAEIKLNCPGHHNQLNAAAAIKAAVKAGVSEGDAIKALESFNGLEHRLELVRELDGVRYYNDSIATTPESVIAAIEAFPEGKVIIMGGYDKGISFSELAEKTIGTVKTVALIGQTADQIEKDINQAKATNLTEATSPTIVKCPDFPTAVKACQESASTGDVVLLSPACASYGMFINFQQRGNEFKALVNQLS